MIFVIFLTLGLLDCKSFPNEESLRVKLEEAQKQMGFDQVEFDRLWNLAMSYGPSYGKKSYGKNKLW